MIISFHDAWSVTHEVALGAKDQLTRCGEDDKHLDAHAEPDRKRKAHGRPDTVADSGVVDAGGEVTWEEGVAAPHGTLQLPPKAQLWGIRESD